jgi:flavin reductase (DIM6/NTAB) family NADH-FMN oxidoreductase RutF
MSAIDSAFSELAGQLDYSMLIVTAAAQNERSGCLVGFASQVSIHPPRFLVCLSVKNHTHRVALTSDVLVVHMVSEDEAWLATLFGGETGDEFDKFAQCRWSPGPGGTPLLTDLADRFVGRVLRRLDFGDHTGFLLAPVEVHRSDGQEPLRFHRAKRIEPGHEA